MRCIGATLGEMDKIGVLLGEKVGLEATVIIKEILLILGNFK